MLSMHEQFNNGLFKIIIKAKKKNFAWPHIIIVRN